MTGQYASIRLFSLPYPFIHILFLNTSTRAKLLLVSVSTIPFIVIKCIKLKVTKNWNVFNLSAVQLLFYFTIPVNPINAMARMPAITSEIETPFIPFGISTNSNCSLIPARITRARPKPIAVDAPKTTPSIRL